MVKIILEKLNEKKASTKKGGFVFKVNKSHTQYGKSI